MKAYRLLLAVRAATAVHGCTTSVQETCQNGLFACMERGGKRLSFFRSPAAWKPPVQARDRLMDLLLSQVQYTSLNVLEKQHPHHVPPCTSLVLRSGDLKPGKSIEGVESKAAKDAKGSKSKILCKRENDENNQAEREKAENDGTAENKICTKVYVQKVKRCTKRCTKGRHKRK